ncbi:MAG: hypothetical protein ACOYOO_04705 [Saprospiraceae bacterium]|jgi:hypothetical protein
MALAKIHEQAGIPERIKAEIYRIEGNAQVILSGSRSTLATTNR